MNSQLNDEILKEIKLTNRLLAQILIMDKESQKEKILTLASCGISPTDIAEVLGIKVGSVTGATSRARKVETQKEKPKANDVQRT